LIASARERTLPAMTSPRFPEPPASHATTPLADLDKLLERAAQKKDAWAQLGIPQRIAYLEAAQKGVQEQASAWVAALNALKGIDASDVLAGEDWLAGPWATARNIRLLIDALKHGGQPKPPGLKQRADGQWVADVFPTSLDEKLAYTGWRAEVWIEPGKARSQGRIYREKQTRGAVALVLGAGNVSSIAPMDVLYKLFVDNEVCILKMNPVNEVGGPFIERAFAALIDGGFLAIVYGGAEVGKHLTNHKLVDSIHITGSDRTHDAIVWGDGPKTGTPRNAKPITSELGCVTPVLVVPGPWSDGDLEFQARQIAGMVAQNGSFNCNAAKVVVTAKGWELRERFLTKLEAALAKAPARKAYYPGAAQRYQQFVEHYPHKKVLGEQGEQIVPWTLFRDVPAKIGEYALTQEAFCGVLAETAIEAKDAVEFLERAVPFCNEDVWGTLSCMLLIHPDTQRQHPAVFDKAIASLRYGGIAVNGWAGAIYGLCHTSWGAFPGHTLEDIQSGRGVVHNTFLFDHPQKSVVYMPFRLKPTPLWFADHKNLRALAEKLTRYEASPSMLKLPGIVAQALKG
jgi:acyl-CoA reductase-like NAD-dependent aldehyde dehydrogenase